MECGVLWKNKKFSESEQCCDLVFVRFDMNDIIDFDSDYSFIECDNNDSGLTEFQITISNSGSQKATQLLSNSGPQRKIRFYRTCTIFTRSHDLQVSDTKSDENRIISQTNSRSQINSFR